MYLLKLFPFQFLFRVLIQVKFFRYWIFRFLSWSFQKFMNHTLNMLNEQALTHLLEGWYVWLHYILQMWKLQLQKKCLQSYKSINLFWWLLLSINNFHLYGETLDSQDNQIRIWNEKKNINTALIRKQDKDSYKLHNQISCIF